MASKTKDDQTKDGEGQAQDGESQAQDGQQQGQQAPESPFAGLTPGRPLRGANIACGDVVHYVLGPGYVHQGEHRPAIVVKVWGEAEDSGGLCQLQVFLDGGNDRPYDGAGLDWRSSVEYSSENIPGTWHWPEQG